MTKIIGLDIGIASLGWSYIDTSAETIIDAGVRTFTRAETPDRGESLAEPRRIARGTRKRLRRRRIRKLFIKKAFIKHDLLIDSDFDNLFQHAFKKSPWQIRSEGLEKLLTPKEFARALIHISNRRGFKSNRKSELQDKDIGKLLSGVRANQVLLSEKPYQTVGEMFYKDEIFAHQKRNKASQYTHTVARSMLEDEVNLLFEKQREFGLKAATIKLQEEFLQNMLWQLSYDHNDNILKMIGHCTFEKNEYRAAKNSYSGESFVLWSKLNNLTLSSYSDKRHLTLNEMRELEALCYKQAKLTYEQIRKALEIDEEYKFAGVNYSQSVAKSPEKTVFMEMKGFHALRKAITSISSQHWELLSKNIQMLNSIGFILLGYKSDEKRLEKMQEAMIPDAIHEKLCGLNFTKTLNLSVKAIDNILPFMQQGMRYDQAIEEFGYEHRQIKVKLKYLPVIDKDDVRNPVVLRALSQCRKVINAIIREHGSPQRIHIELSRELSKSFKDRKQIEKRQKEFRTQKQAAAKQFEDIFSKEANGLDLLKFRLHKQQGGYCIYSGDYIEPERINEIGYVEIDHALPYSRSNDNSLSNKVLCLTSENQQKGNAIPFEYFTHKYGNESNEWRLYADRCKNLPYTKKQKLLRERFNKEDSAGFKERNLNDTRYIARFLKNYISDHLELAPSDFKVPIQTNNGALTSFLRARWGLLKNRDENDLHHCIDAFIVAASTPSMIQRISNYHRKNELYATTALHIPTMEIIDKETGEVVDSQYREISAKHFPEVWKNFRRDIIDYVKNQVFVSRMPNRKVKGSAHKETIRSAKHLDDEISIVKTPISKLTLKSLENLYQKERNYKLYKVLKKRLELHAGKADKAFAEPIYMPVKKSKNQPVIRSVKLVSTQKTGVRVNEGIADNGGMVRVDVFTKDKKFYLVPIYVADMVKKELPNKAIVAHKNENDWPEMTQDYDFIFSLFPNDLVKVSKDKKFEYFGYFKSAHRGTGSINLEAADRAWSKDAIGVKTLNVFEKYQVDVLGNYNKVTKEKRLGGMA